MNAGIQGSLRDASLAVVAILAAQALLPSADVRADGIQYALRAGANYSDNINRLPSGQEQDTSAIVAGVEARGRRETGRFRYDVAADISRYEFLDLNLPGQTLGRGFASGAWDLVPSSFTWNARVDYDQIREDILRPFAVGNLADQVTFSTGPTLTARLGSSWEALLDGRYTTTDFSAFGVDNETVGGQFVVQHRLGSQAVFGIGAARDDVAYDDSPNFDYDRQEVFLRLSRTGARTFVDLQVGYSEVSGRNFTNDGEMIRANVTRQLSPALSAFVNYVREYPTSNATLIGGDPTFSGGGLLDASFLTASPRLAKSGGAGLLYSAGRTRAELAYSLREDKSLLAGLGSRNYDEYRARLSREITPRTSGAIYVVRTDESFTSFTQRFNDQLLGAQLAFGVGSPLGIDIRLEYRTRDAGRPADEFSELSGGVFLRYSGQLGGGTPTGQSRPVR